MCNKTFSVLALNEIGDNKKNKLYNVIAALFYSVGVAFQCQ